MATPATCTTYTSIAGVRLQITDVYLVMDTNINTEGTSQQFTSEAELDSFSSHILRSRRTITTATALTDDARELVSLLLNNHEVLDMNKIGDALLPYVDQAIENEKRKSDAGVTVSSTDWDGWRTRLQAGELQLNREFLPEVWRWTEAEILRAEIKFAQEAQALSPTLTPIQEEY